jgi:hypothetical protein
MKYWKTLLAAAGMTIAGASAAQALTVTFDFSTQSGVPVALKSYSAGGINLDVTALTTDESRNLLAVPASVSLSKAFGDPNKGGLGVANSSADDHRIDGKVGLNDLLSLVFDRKVKLVSALFSNVDASDDFDFWVGSPSLAGGYQFTAPTPLPLAQYNFTSVFGSIFGFGAIGTDDDFKLKSITVSTIPLPPAAILLITGLLGIGILGRRRKAARRA